MLGGEDRELYIKWLMRAIEWRDLSNRHDPRLDGCTPQTIARVRKRRRDYMRTWARMAVHHTGGCRGPIRL